MKNMKKFKVTYGHQNDLITAEVEAVWFTAQGSKITFYGSTNAETLAFYCNVISVEISK